jgi:hypothetical protein
VQASSATTKILISEQTQGNKSPCLFVLFSVQSALFHPQNSITGVLKNCFFVQPLCFAQNFIFDQGVRAVPPVKFFTCPGVSFHLLLDEYPDFSTHLIFKLFYRRPLLGTEKI